MTDGWLYEKGLQRKILRSAQWFYWIVGLGLLNAILLLAKINIHLICDCLLIDMGFFNIGYLIKNPPKEMAEVVYGAQILLLVTSLTVCLFFVLFGWQGGKFKGWPFVVGMILYSSDATLCFFDEDYIACLFHIFVLYQIFIGYKSLRMLKSIQKVT